VTPSDRNRWNKSIRRESKQDIFIASLTMIILNCFLCVLDERSKERPGLDCTFMFETFFWKVVARVCRGGGGARIQVLAHCCVAR